jgi:F0F1-type ATP synthase delta subunit
VIDSAVIERYARAIFELGVESGQLSGLTQELGRFAAAYESSRELRCAETRCSGADATTC